LEPEPELRPATRETTLLRLLYIIYVFIY